MAISELITWETVAVAVGALLAIALFGLLVIGAVQKAWSFAASGKAARATGNTIKAAWRVAASKRRGGRDARQGTNKRRGGVEPRQGRRSWLATPGLPPSRSPLRRAEGRPGQLRLAALAALILAACVAAAIAAAQELIPKSHEPPQPPPAPRTIPDAGGAPFADVRARLPMDAGGREFRQDQIEDRDVLYNLQLFFHKGSPPGRIACPDGGGPTRLSAVVLEGVHQHEQALRFTADTRAAGAVHTSSLFLRAIAYYRGHGLDGRCEGREIRGAIELVRLTDGAWFAPEWRRSLVKRR